EEVARAGAASAAVDRLHPFASEIEDELREVVAVRRDLGVPVAVQLKLAQHEIQRVDFNFLNKQRTPSGHRVGYVLAKAGKVLTQSAIFSVDSGFLSLRTHPSSS